MKIAFVSGAYRSPTIAGVLANITAARAVAVELWRQGYAVICPHLNSALMDGLCDDSVWLAGDLELLRRSDLVVMVPGWEQSEGARAERAEAQRLGIEVREWREVT